MNPGDSVGIDPSDAYGAHRSSPIPVLRSPSDEAHRSAGDPRRFAPAVARILWAIGVIYFVGSLVDLGILWLGQRQPGIQWEFVAVSNTAVAWPRLVMAVAFAYVGAYVGGRAADWVFRTLGAVTLLLGLGAAAVGGLAVLNTLTVLHGTLGSNAAMVKTTAAKTLILCLMYVVLLVPLGAMGLRRPRP